MSWVLQMMKNVMMETSSTVMVVAIPVLVNIVVMAIVIAMDQTMMESVQKNVICEQTTVFCDDCVRVLVPYQMTNVSSVMNVVMEVPDHTISSCSWMFHDR